MRTLNFIFRLEIYIFSMKMHVFTVNIYIFSLKMNLASGFNLLFR